MVIVYQKPDDLYLTDLVVGIITKMGMYLNTSQARHMIVKGQVVIDGRVEMSTYAIVPVGLHEFVLGERKVVVEVREMKSL